MSFGVMDCSRLAVKWMVIAVLSALVFSCGQRAAAPEKPAAEARGKVEWMSDYEKAAARAREQKKPMMVDVMADWCSICKRMDTEVFSRADVAASAAKFVAVKVDGDKRPELKKKFDVSGYPTFILQTPEEKELGRVRGGVPYQLMIKALDEAAGKYR